MQMVKNIFCLLFLLSTFILNVNAQVVATGHIFAEIVETIGTKSAVTNMLTLQHKGQTDNLDLGSIKLNGNSSSICNVIVSSSQLRGENGGQVSFFANDNFRSQEEILNAKGENLICLKGSVGTEIFQSDNIDYTGQYYVIFAYN
jgi:hypothetical protein